MVYPTALSLITVHTASSEKSRVPHRIYKLVQIVLTLLSIFELWP
jgi:hypothetical protein